MSTAQLHLKTYEYNRNRTLDLLSTIEKLPNPQAVLSWRPGAGRAHIGWQLMHVAITEEIFATERLKPERPPAFAELWPRFRGGSTPDDDVPSADVIRRILGETREHLVSTLAEYGDDRLEEIPASLAARKITVRTVLDIIGWHEPHHHGQAHITLNLYRAAHPPA
ncbi:MAG TPA: DinB family protein [Pirellulales bacterium]|jgi:uncharacterized damage-inducible protein DinB|nr:DinB family protein [Pirellulales bacterium]